MIGTYFISTPISKSLQIDRSFFFQLPPIETITSQAINLTPSTVWCRAAYFATLRGWPSWSLRPGHGCLGFQLKKPGDEWLTYSRNHLEKWIAIVLNQVLTNWDKENRHQSHPEVPADEWNDDFFSFEGHFIIPRKEKKTKDGISTISR